MIQKIIRAIKFTLKFIILKFRFGKRIAFKGVGRLYFRTDIVIKNNGFISIGERAQVLENSKLTADGGRLIIGDNVDFNRNTLINSHLLVSIGDDTIIGPNCCIYDHDHVFKGGIVRKDCYTTKEVIIGKNCWIGAGSIVLKGTIIGDNCVIGAGTIVSGIISNNSIVKTNRDLEIEKIH